MKTLKLTFHGGAGMVTGSNFLLEGNSTKLLVDCGLVQGCKICEDINREPFPYDPKSIQVLIITHAHLDHIGRVPRLVREGFTGIIYSTPSTKEIAEAMLTDSIGVLTKEAERDGKEPIYTSEDVSKTFALWKEVDYHKDVDINKEFTLFLKDAGHILGSAIVELTHISSGKKIVFTGDLGNSPAPFLRDTERISDADYVIMESVYGNRDHEDVETRTRLLEKIIEDTVSRKGALMIPAFSIERTQVLLYEMNKLVEDGRIPRIPIFLDSPLAIEVTHIYKNYIKNFKKDIQDEHSIDDIFNFPGLKFTKSSAESRSIVETPNPKVIIAGSGMSNGGRIVFHEKRYLSDPDSTLLLVGYQAAGSLGRQIADGAKEVTILNEKVPVKAHIEKISGYSAHRDSTGLIEFIDNTSGTVTQVFVAMGEPKSSLHLVQRLRDYLGISAVAPEKGQSFDLEV
tara:strand:+ start:10138 stop:11505 length:1368 start_codon:yes stop_codon:yes gene_type:complete